MDTHDTGIDERFNAWFDYHYDENVDAFLEKDDHLAFDEFCILNYYHEYQDKDKFMDAQSGHKFITWFEKWLASDKNIDNDFSNFCQKRYELKFDRADEYDIERDQRL